MKNKNTHDAMREYHKKVIEDFDNNGNRFLQNSVIPYIELGYVYSGSGCDGFCPECRQIEQCEAYEDIKDGWRLFYS